MKKKTAYKQMGFALTVLALAGCGDHRDLYDIADAKMHVEGSWTTSLGKDLMYDATVLFYNEGAAKREYLLRPNGTTTSITSGHHDVAVFNGVMESEQRTNLDDVLFRGTDRLETFEAYAAEGKPNPRLSRAEGEYIASNDMEILTFTHDHADIDLGGKEGLHYIKYENGKEIPFSEEEAPGLNHTVEVIPRAVSHWFQVRMTRIVNPRSALNVAGALKGFVGSIFVPHHGMDPLPGFPATHHITLAAPSGKNVGTRADGVEVGTLISPEFVTFGPPLPEEGTDPAELPASGKYFFDPVFVLADGTTWRRDRPFDVTRQVNEAIARLIDHHDDTKEDIAHDENLFIIVIDEEVGLPVVSGGGDGGDDGGPAVTVDPWEDDEEIIVWIRN